MKKIPKACFCMNCQQKVSTFEGPKAASSIGYLLLFTGGDVLCTPNVRLPYAKKDKTSIVSV